MIALNRVLLLILLSNISINGFHLKNGVKEDFQCEKLYGTFFIDKSIPGNSVMEKQTEIIKSFFNVNYRPTLTSFVSSSSQIETAITNKFDTVEPFNYKFLNEQFGSILEKTSVDENVSFYKLAAEVLVNVDYTDIEKYTQRPLITLMINSFVEDKETTENLLNNIKKFNPTVKIVAIIFDEMFAEDAIFLTGDSSLVFKFDKTLENDVNNAGAWLVNQICGDLTPAETVPVPSTINDACPSSFCNFAFAIDSSSDILTQDLFSTEISITTNSIGPLIPDFTKVAVVSYNQGVSGFSDFNSIPDENTFNQTLASYTLSTGFSLTNALAKIDSLTPPLNGKLTTYVFISKYDPADYASAIPYSISLTNKGSLNFIILGTATNKNDLSQLTYSQYFALTFANSCDQAAIKNFIYGSMTCNNPICTTTVSPVSTTTTSPVSTTTTSPVSTTTTSQCVPQNTQCNVAIAVDASNDILIDQYFNSEKNVITNNISGVFSDFTKIELQAYNGQVTPIFGFNGISTKDQFINSVNGITNGPGFDFSDSLARIDQTSPSNGVGLSTYIFVSKNDQAQFMQAMSSAASLKSKGSLNFIILGTDVKPSDLQMLNPSSIVTYNLGDCDDGTLLNFFTHSLTCTVVCPSTTTQVPSTTTTQVPSTTSSQVSTTTTSQVLTTTTTSPQCVSQPTQCNVAIAVDTSNDILEDFLFRIELDVIANNVSTVFTDFTKVALQGYNQVISPIYNFNSIPDQNTFKNDVLNSMKQNSGFSFYESLNNINLMQLPNSVGLSTFIFISENNQAEFYKSIDVAQSLKNKGSLNLIILGTALQPKDLQMLSATNVSVFQLAECDATLWVNLFTNSIVCNTPCVSTTTLAPTTTTQTSSTTSVVTTTSPVSTTTVSQCVPQNTQCNVAIAVDASNDILIDQYFNSEKNVITNNISGVFTDFTKIELQAYNGQVTSIFGFNGISTKDQFINSVNGITNGPGFDFSDSLARIDQTSPSNGVGLSTYIFVSKNDQAQFMQAMSSAASLKSKGSLNFIILGTDVKPSDLQMLNPSSIVTYNLGDCDDGTLVNFFTLSLTCTVVCPSTTTQVPSTTTTQVSTTTTQVSTTTQVPSTTTTPVSTTTTSPVSTTTVSQCVPQNTQCNVAIAVDASNDILIDQYFNSEKNVITNNISGVFSDFTKIELQAYNGQVTPIFGFNGISTKDQFVNSVNGITNGPGFDFSDSLARIDQTSPSNGVGLSTYIFVSKNDQAQFMQAMSSAASLKNKGSLNFIILGTDVKPSDLQMLNPSSIVTYNLGDCDDGTLLNFFTHSLTCTVVCSSTTTQTPSTTTTQVPSTTTSQVTSTTTSQVSTTTTQQCVSQNIQCNIAIAVDASTDILINQYFNAEKVAIASNISGIFTDYTRIELQSYNGQITPIFGFNGISSQPEFINYVNGITNGPGFDFKDSLARIDQTSPSNGIGLSTYIFVSKNDQDQFSQSLIYANSLISKGSLSFIILGTDLKPSDLQMFNTPNIFTYDLGDCDDAMLMNFFNHQLMCNAPCLTTTTQTPSTTTSQPSTTTQLSTTTSQASSTTTPCPCPTQICDMAIVIDSSNDFLTLEYFNNEKQSLQYNISDQFTDFSRIALLNYDSSTTVVGNFGQMSNQSDFNTKINYMNQNQGSSLSTALNTLLSLTPPNNGILNSFIYISQITPQELTASIPLVAQLTSYGTVNFIILGTALKPSDIAPLNPTNVIEFDLALCDSGPVSQFFNTSLQCTQICGTLTQSNNLIFAVDASSDVLDATEFQYQKDTLVNNISSIINNYRSTALTWYNSVPNTVYGFGQISNVFEFQQDSLLIQQNSGSKLSLLLSALDSMTLTANIADTFVFISKNDPTEINNSINSALSLTKKGTLSFILVGTDIHPGDLSQLPLDSNAIFVWDFTNCPIANLVNFFSSRIKTSAQCISPKYVPY